MRNEIIKEFCEELIRDQEEIEEGIIGAALGLGVATAATMAHAGGLTTKKDPTIYHAIQVGGAVAGHFIQKFISQSRDESERNCKKFPYGGAKRANCMINSYKQSISKTRGLINKCSKSKDPEKCRKILEKSIEKYEAKISKYQEDIKNYPNI